MKTKILLPLVISVLLTSAAHSVMTSTDALKAGGGLWTDPQTWETYRVPSYSDAITIEQGLTVYIDSNACKALSLTLQQGSMLVYQTGTRSLSVKGDVALGQASEIQMENAAGQKDTFSLSAIGNLALDKDSVFNMHTQGAESKLTVNVQNITMGANTGAHFDVTLDAVSTATVTCYDLGLAGSDAHGSRFTVSMNSANSFFRLRADAIAVGNLGDFNMTAGAGSTIAEAFFAALTIGGSPGGIYGTADFYCQNITSTMTLTMTGGAPCSIINNGVLRMVGADPGGAVKPDPETARRSLWLCGDYNNSFVQSMGYLCLYNAGVKYVGVLGVTDEYGLCLLNNDGVYWRTSSDIINCEIRDSVDTGLYLRSSKRLNDSWNHAISSSIIHGCGVNGVLVDNSQKNTVANCRVYSNVGINVGYGIHMVNTANENTVASCDIYDNKIRGIFLENSNKNLLDSNRVHNQRAEEGIVLYKSSKNTLFNNECYSNPVHGIALDGLYGNFDQGSSYNYIAGNRCWGNANSGMRLRYGSNGNIFVMNTSSANTISGLSSHSSVDNTFAAEYYHHNGSGDVYIEGKSGEPVGCSQLWFRDCTMASANELSNITQRNEFTLPNSWMISQKHDGNPGLTKIWGDFQMPQSGQNWHSGNKLKFNYSDLTYNATGHGWNNGTDGTNNIPMLRYDDAGADGLGGNHDIVELAVSSATLSQAWLVSYGFGPDSDQWQVRGSSSGVMPSPAQTEAYYQSDQISFRITHHDSPAPGEQYVFLTMASANDAPSLKTVRFCDFSDPQYLGAKFTNNSGATFEMKGTGANMTQVTRELAADVQNTSFYYGFTLGGDITQVQYATFTYVNLKGVNLVSAPALNTDHLNIARVQPGGSYVSANGITHTFDNVNFETGTVNMTAFYVVTATNSVLTFRDYTRPSLPDYLNSSTVYWDPTLSWSGLSGFGSDGVEPNDAVRMTKREFQVRYYDRGLASGGDVPTTVQVWLDLNDNEAVDSGEVQGMTFKQLYNVNDPSQGAIYTYSKYMDYIGDGTIKYRFLSGNTHSVTVDTTTGNSSYMASGDATLDHTFTIKGTPPRVTIQPVTDQYGQISISYNLADDDHKKPPNNYCTIAVKYQVGLGEWTEATEGAGGNGTGSGGSILVSSGGVGTPYVYVWDSSEDIPEVVEPVVRIQITPTDEDGTGEAAQSAPFYVDNIRVSKLVFTGTEQDLPFGVTSQVVTVQAMSAGNNKDINAVLNVDLNSSSTNYSFVDPDYNNVITSATFLLGDIRFRYVDNIVGHPNIIVSENPSQSIVDAFQTWTINAGGTNQNTSSVTTISPTAVVGTTVTVIVTCKDYFDHAVSNKLVHVDATGSDNVVTQPISVTDPSGNAYAKIWSSKAEKKILTASDITDGVPIRSSCTVTFTPGAVDPGLSSFTISPLGKLTSGTTDTIYVTLLDMYQNPVDGKIIRMSLTPAGLGDAVPTTMPIAPTNTLGQSSATFSPGAQGDRVLTVKDITDNITLTSSMTVTVVFDAVPPSITATVPANNSTVNVAVQELTATIADTGGSGVNLTSSTIRLYGPDSAEISGTKSIRGADTIVLSGINLTDNGIYTITVVGLDMINNVSPTYTATFTLSIVGPEQEEQFKNSVYAYPNPARGVPAKIHCIIPFTGNVTVKIFNVMGELVYSESHPNEAMAPAGKDYTWNAVNTSNLKVGSGMYIFELTLDNGLNKYTQRKKVLIIK